MSDNARIETAHVGALGTDCVTVLNRARAMSLKAWGMKFAIRYLGTLSQAETDAILDAGLALMPVTYGLKHGTSPSAAFGASYGQSSVADAHKAGILPGCTVWLDLEDMTGTDEQIIAFVNAWCGPVKGAGFVPGLYVGAGAQLSSQQLYGLSVVRYWQSLSKEVDRRGLISEPACGWCMIQLFPSTMIAGTFVDVDVVQQDYRTRLPTWMVRS